MPIQIKADEKIVMKIKKFKNTFGVTVVEILIVIAVIGIVAVFAIPNYMRQRETANAATMEALARQLAQKMEQIFWGQEPNGYPPQSAMADGLVTWATPTNLANIQDLLKLLEEICKKQGKIIQIDSSTSASSLAAIVESCFNTSGGTKLVYTTPSISSGPIVNPPASSGEGAQSYLFSLGSSDGSTDYSVSPGGVSSGPQPCSDGASSEATEAPPCETFLGDIASTCNTNEDCDNGLWCDGVDTCENGICVSGGDDPCSTSAWSCREAEDNCLGDGACGNGSIEGGEQCDGANVCPSGYICQACVCNPLPPPEECPPGCGPPEGPCTC